jgi:hypothetical protein
LEGAAFSKEQTMKTKHGLLFSFAVLLAAAMFALTLAGCPIGADPTGAGGEEDPKYENFYKYPSGREDGNGTLTIKNGAASPVLLFTSSVASENYIGTAGSLSSIKVKLPDDKFYTIVAVDKAKWEEKGAQAAQFSVLSYYSSQQGYSVTVTPNSNYGTGEWIISNYTDYWVTLKKSDLSVDYAVVAPQAKRVIVPIQIGETYDYIPYYFKELKYQNKIVALVEGAVLAGSDTVSTDQDQPTFNTNLGGGNQAIQPPSSDLKPAIYFTNSSDKTVRVYISGNNQLKAIGFSGTDFSLASGKTQMFTDGIESGTSTNAINFESLAWNGVKKYVSQDIAMEKNKVYRIILKGSDGNYTTTCEEEEASEYFE